MQPCSAWLFPYLTMEGKVQEAIGSRIRLYFAVAVVNLLYVGVGCVMAWTSPTVPKLSKFITHEQASWIGSLYSLGATFGPIITYLGLDNIGRKGTLYILAGCYIISWITLAVSTNIYVIYVGRIIGGIGVGGTFSCCPVFVAEIADDKNRGMLGSVTQATMAIGFLMEYCIGPYTTYFVLTTISVIPIIAFIALFYLIPESPYYLMIKNRKAEAIESLKWYRGADQSYTVEQELTCIEESVELRKSNKVGISGLWQRGPQKALLISLYLLIIQQGSGNNAIISFAEYIFEMGHIAVTGSMCAIIGGITNLVGGIMTPFAVRKFSMKTSFLISAFGVAITLGLLALYFYLQSSGADGSKVWFLPLAAYILFNIFFCLGCGPLPWPMLAEMYPIEVKSMASCLCGIFSCLFGFIVIQITAEFLNLAGPTTVFASLCLFVALISFGAVFLVPDTTGLSLPEIHNYLATGKRPQKYEDN